MKNLTQTDREARNWPENARPTPEQLRDWLRVLSDPALLEFAEMAQRASAEAATCWQQDHEGRIDRLTEQVTELRAQLAAIRGANR